MGDDISHKGAVIKWLMHLSKTFWQKHFYKELKLTLFYMLTIIESDLESIIFGTDVPNSWFLIKYKADSFEKNMVDKVCVPFLNLICLFFINRRRYTNCDCRAFGREFVQVFNDLKPNYFVLRSTFYVLKN